MQERPAGVYRWAVSAVAAIGAGAFAVSFLALRDLMRAIGYSSATAWIFPAIIDTTVAVSTPDAGCARRQASTPHPYGDNILQCTNSTRATAGVNVRSKVQRPTSHPFAPTTARAQTVQAERVKTPVPLQPDPTQTVQDSAQTGATQVDAEVVHVDADLASELIASGVTTQPVETVIAVLSSHRGGASINRAAKGSGINYRTARRIVEGAAEHRQRQLVAVG